MSVCAAEFTPTGLNETKADFCVIPADPWRIVGVVIRPIEDLIVDGDASRVTIVVPEAPPAPGPLDVGLSESMVTDFVPVASRLSGRLADLRDRLTSSVANAISFSISPNV